MKTTTKILCAGIFALLVLTAVSCGKLDVVGTNSIASFDKVLRQIPQAVTPDETNGGWSLAAPDGTVRFIWSKNYAESPLHDVMLEFDAAPFIAAGLDPERLPENFAFSKGMIMVGTKLGGETLKYAGEVTPLASYEQIVKLKRSSIGYHGALDHYGVSLGDGNLFEWAKNMGANDKDIVFVLNPEPFIAAGVDPSRIEGWAFAKVTVDDANGKPVEVDKILKPFNLI
ncbi:hypothetical protein LQZ21_06795 [Treponema sp. TIM-1]|uniref:hypothetical protein n=1 Tax=Treponema sp. TIM-1 TaxID=2898417 RepID=UPI003981465D